MVVDRTKPKTKTTTKTTTLYSSTSNNEPTPQPQQQHPAVERWPEKYAECKEKLLSSSSQSAKGPRILHHEFTVERATNDALDELDVYNWPTWSTVGNPKWVVGKQNIDKVMPYGELSYVLEGKLEIIVIVPPESEEEASSSGGESSRTSTSPTAERFVVQTGDFVTFPKDFQASWTVLEELTWHYYLY